ncbi:hypothetical protein BV394_04060 [Brevirhabdus pacifica]|uniref:sucrose-phosphate synthase n=3 Tax=Brevirhabdus pacifica TaxID=1267768 RepID=A0A1U7DGB2_9RHOB|nr:hypothetical protein BV394_04060 [Brevirhabdus pacifica]
MDAAHAQAQLSQIRGVEILTRRFSDPRLGSRYEQMHEDLGHGVRLTRIWSEDHRYLEKDALIPQLPSFTEGVISYLESLGDKRPDLIHAHFADAAEVAIAIRERLGIPFIYTAHSLAIDKREVTGQTNPSLEARIEREGRAIAEADAIIASSRDEAERQLMCYPSARQERIHRVMPGIGPCEKGCDSRRARKLLQPFLRDMDKPLILTIARPVAKKNLPALVDIYAETPGLREKANLAVIAGLRDEIGDETTESGRVHRGLVEAVDRHNLYGCVAYPKKHEPEDIASLYTLASEARGIFVNPALTEPFGLTLLEAASYGLPVVATAHGGPVDIVDLLHHGVCADPGDHKAFGGAILELIDDDQRRAEAAQAARTNSARWNWKRYALEHLRIANRLVRRPRVLRLATPEMALFSDIDNTLTGNLRASARFADWRYGQRGWLFAVATGRSLPEARFTLSRWGLPEPDLFISSVGSEIYRSSEEGLVFDSDYADHLSQGWEPDRIRELLRDCPVIVPQADIEQRRFKVSYYTLTEGARQQVCRLLSEAGLKARVILSHGNFLDILPERAGKAAAMRWVAERRTLQMAQCVAAGDSGNDSDLLESCHRSIIVRNHSAELDHLVDLPNVYRSSKPFADGVLEGVERWAGARATPRRMPQAPASEKAAPGSKLERELVDALSAVAAAPEAGAKPKTPGGAAPKAAEGPGRRDLH